MKRSMVARCVCSAGVALWLIAGARSARADTLSFGPDNEGPFSGSTTGTFTLPQFDTLGGSRTLVGVTLSVTIDSFGGSREFDNESGAGGLATLSIGSTVRVKGPASPSLLVVIPDAVTTASATITGDTDGVPVDFAGTDYFGMVGLTQFDTKSATRTSAADMAPYIGGGNVTFAWDLAGNSTSGEDVSAFGGGTFRTTNTTYNFHTTVTYEFVPEPASMALLVPGALLLLRRRRRHVG